MNKVQRYVSYVVGTFLVFPLRVIHVLPEEDAPKQEQPQHKQAGCQYQGKKTRTKRSQQGVKRNSGQAQKSVRLKHKIIAALKKR